MNYDQAMMLLRIALTAGGSIASAKGVDMAQYNTVSGSIVTVVGGLTVVIPIVWGWFIHKDGTNNVADSK